MSYLSAVTSGINKAFTSLKSIPVKQYSAMTALALVSIGSFAYSYSNTSRLFLIAKHHTQKEFELRTAPIRLYTPIALFTISNTMLGAFVGRISNSLNFLTSTSARRYSFMAASVLVGIGSFAYSYTNLQRIYLLEQKGFSDRTMDESKERRSRKAPIRLYTPVVLFAISNIMLGALLARK